MPTDTRRSRADAVVRELAKRLNDPEATKTSTIETSSGIEETSIWRHLSLSAGYPGVSLLFAELAADDGRYAAALHTYLAAAGRHINDSPGDGAFGGLGAFAAATRTARQAVGGYDKAQSTLDEAVSSGVRQRLEAGVPDDLDFSDYDVISGVSGLLRQFLREPGRHRELVTAAADWLTGLCLRDGAKPGWWVDHGPNPFVVQPKGGHGNLGLSHGAAGILAALCHAERAHAAPAETAAAIDRLADWLVAQQRASAAGPGWPMYIIDDPDSPGSTYGDPGWCYGTPGIAWALQLAAKCRGRDDWADLAESAFDAAVAVADRLPDTGLCHGVAGLAHVLWRFDSKRYSTTIDGLVDRILEAYSYEAPFGFAFRSNDGPLDHPGFIDGAAGVGLTLHRYARDAEPKVAWDSLLML